MLPTAANREVQRLLLDGVRVSVRDARGDLQPMTVRVIDWAEPTSNDFLLASQVWFAGDLYKRRADLVGFVNGIPLLFIECKAVHKNLKDAHENNLRDYRQTVPQVFWANGFVILSNGKDTVVGAPNADFDHFTEWKRIDDEGSEGIVSLDTVIRATSTKERLLDLVENFIAFQEERGGLVKKVGMNHQLLGVNRALAAVREIKANKGRLGVFWHTQGSGKSLSMVYFAQKVLRKLPGNWTFVIVTDRQELDDQITGTFVSCGAVTKEAHEVQAQSRAHLRTLLTGNERYVFTLIQKFSTERGEVFPQLSDRSDIIVITDEAHRSQYDQLAANMRRALPNAAFIGFTGTPLMAGEERTREVFGDYVSVYHYAQSTADGATVPLFYENRIPELQLTNTDLSDDLEELLDNAELDEEQEKRLAREFARQYHIITRDDRLEKIAEDVVRHFVGRGYRGKAMYIAIDKATAVRMYDKVKRRWAEHLNAEEARVAKATPEEKPELQANLDWLRETEMAVVVSQAQNEIEDMKKKGLDILPHRQRMVKENLDEKFKDPKDHFRLVFVCAMWITGFDVPTCSTIYLDKPMKNHTLMQTIARANRRAPGKTAGVIVDYVGVFKNLQRALAIYAPQGGSTTKPIEDKTVLVEALRKAIRDALAFCSARGVDPLRFFTVQKFERVKLVADAVDALISPEEVRKQFLQRAGRVWTLYKAILPDQRAHEFTKEAASIQVIAESIRNQLGAPDISGIMADVEKLLDASIAGVEITAPIRAPGDTEGLFDLSKIDFDKLRKLFEKGHKKTEAERLRALAEGKVREMVRANPTRVELMEKLQKLIDAYNAGSVDVEKWFQQLVDFIQTLSDEDRRAVREGLTEDELALFDVLTKPEPQLTKSQEAEVKKIAKGLLEKLNREKLVIDWLKKAQTKADVRQTIEMELDRLPAAYRKSLWQEKVDLTYQFVVERYAGIVSASED